MAIYDSVDLLARFVRKAGVPSVRTFPEDSDIYAWLTDANVKWHNVIAQHAPWSQYVDPVKLTTSDSGTTYDFASGIYPIGSIELYDSPVRGRLLTPGTYWDPNADYVFEGTKIRIPRGLTEDFGDGPYARYMADADEISANSPPVLNPPSINAALLVPTACAYWAARGGMKDPRPFLNEAQDAWAGDERTEWGILGMLKTQNAFQGLEAFSQPDGSVLGSVTTGAGYRSI